MFQFNYNNEITLKFSLRGGMIKILVGAHTIWLSGITSAGATDSTWISHSLTSSTIPATPYYKDLKNAAIQC